MALNFGILQPVNIGGQIMAGQQEAQRNQLAQQQLRAGEMQQQKAEMELTDFKAKQEGLDKFLQLSAANGKTGSPEDLASSFYDFALSQRDPQLIMTAQTLAQAAKERSAYNASRQPPKLSPVAPAPGALGSGTFDVNAPMPAANRLAPAPVAPAAPVNQLGADTTALENRIIDLQTNYPNVPQAQAEAARLTKQLDEARKLYAVGGNLVTGTGKPIFTAPKEAAAPPAMVAEYTFAKTPEGGGFKGSYQQFVTARAAAGRAPAQPVAPTITQIVDPTNPNQMITIDAKRYQGGGVGSPGVIGVGGKEPGAALRVNKVEQGKTQLADDLENLRASFETLDKLRAVPSTERGPLSNVASGIASTAIGQRTGQFFATEAQVERDVINSARSRLVNSIKNATGMSAQQLNSNVELQTMLKSISDPGQSYQSAIRIIQDIEDAYVTGSGMLPKKDKPGGAPAAAQGTGGFKYLGKESK